MSLFRRLFGGGRKDQPPPPPDDDAGPPRPERPGVFGDSPLHRLLDEVGLPWRTLRGELTARHGVEVDPAYAWDVLPLPGATPLLDGLIRPVTARGDKDLAPQHPPTDLSAMAWWRADARENIQRAFDALAPRLGKSRIARRQNILQAEWTFGAAGLTLTVWPEDLQSVPFEIEAHARDPRLVTACHVDIRTGYRLRLDEEERLWLDGFRPLLAMGGKTSRRQLREGPVPESELAFIREPPEAVGPWLDALGVSAGGEALIWTEGQLYVVPTADVAGLMLQRLLPAKGGGGAWLAASVRTGDPARPTDILTLATSTQPEGLTAPARKLAEAIGRPLKMEKPTYDV